MAAQFKKRVYYLYNGTFYSYKSNITVLDVCREIFWMNSLASGTSQQQLSPRTVILVCCSKCQVGLGLCPPPSQNRKLTDLPPQCSIGSSGTAPAGAGSSAGWATWDKNRRGLAQKLHRLSYWDISDTIKRCSVDASLHFTPTTLSPSINVKYLPLTYIMSIF